MPGPELPGEFVSEELRADCARFLEELRVLVRHRSELPRKGAPWVRDDGENQSLLNYRSAQSGR
jgi:hypothetical protein